MIYVGFWYTVGMDTETIRFHSRPIAGAAAGAIFGVLLGALLRLPILAVCIAVSAAAAGVFVVRKRIGWGLLLILFGAVLLRTALVPLDSVDLGEYLVSGTVAETPENKSKTTAVVLKNASLDGESLKARISLRLPKTDLSFGDVIRVKATVRSAADPLRAAADGISTEGVSDAVPEIIGHSEDAYGALLAVRGYFANAIDWLFEKQAGSAKGMLIGDRSDLDYQMTSAYAANGVMHLFAVSGMHVTALLTLLGLVFRSGKRWLDLLLLALIAALYSALTNFTPSVLRAAFFMLAIRAAILSDRQPDAPSAFCFSIVGVLLLNPYDLFTAGFLLSFSSMAGIVLLPDRFCALLHLPNNRITTALFAALAAFIGSLPIQAYFFSGISWMAIPMGVALAPFMTVLMPLAFCVMLLSPVLPWTAKLLAYIPRGGFILLETVGTMKLGEKLALPAPHVLSVMVYYIGLLFCSDIYLPNRKRAPIPGLVLIAVSIVLWIVL